MQGKWYKAGKQCHVNVLELLVVWKVLTQWVRNFHSTSVMIATGNSTAYIKKQGQARSKELLETTIKFTCGWKRIGYR